MARTYTYHPLNHDRKEVRILWLRPQALDDLSPLQGHLQSLSLLQDAFKAVIPISYVWGDDSKRKSMFIDDLPLDVPESADTALRYLLHFISDGIGYDHPGSSSVSKLPFWIDAVCIDQACKKERAQQVTLMKDIYSLARVTFIWLGEDTDGRAKKGLDALEKVYRTDNQLQSFREAMQELSKDERESIGAFFSSIWYSRTWTIQEAVLPPEAWCFKGLYVVDWKVVTVFAHNLMFLPTYPAGLSSQSHDLGQAARLGLLRRHRNMDMRSLLALTADSDATNPLDKVYALLGLMDDQAADQITIDYYAPPTVVYTTATRVAAARKESVQILQDAQSRMPPAVDPVKGDMPSWVVRYHWSLGYPQEYQLREMPSICMDNYGYMDVGQPHILRMRGVVVDKIARDPIEIVGAQTDDSRPRILQPSSLQAAWEAARGARPSDLTHCMEKELGNVLTTGRYPMTNAVGGGLEVAAYQLSFRRLLPQRLETLASQALDLADDRNKGADLARRQILTQCWKRHFVTTKHGRLGVAWHRARKGDAIAYIFGCDIPLILRPEDDHWILIGDAYVYGAMDYSPVLDLQEQGRLEAEMRWIDIH